MNLNQNGFFALLLVAVTSFALWSTMSTMYIYSGNKSENLAKIKETVDMNAVMSGFAIEARDAFYRHYIANAGNKNGTDCPTSHGKLCKLDSGKNLCLKNDKCNTCLTDLEYCANFSKFTGNDAFGDCGDPDVLCVVTAIDGDHRDEPPDPGKLDECTSCFVQPLKIYLDTSSTSPPSLLPSVPCNNSCSATQECCNGVCTTPACTVGSCPTGQTCEHPGIICDANCKPDIECSSDAECTDYRLPVCDVNTNTCVQCLSDQSCYDHGFSGTICSKDNRCVECLGDYDCPPGERCGSGYHCVR